MQVEHNGTHDVCVKYCPIPPEESMDGGRDQFLDQNATNLGKVTYKGHEAIHWQWNQTIFGVITMEITDFYASPDDVPIAAIQTLTPFGGPAIGGQIIPGRISNLDHNLQLNLIFTMPILVHKIHNVKNLKRY